MELREVPPLQLEEPLEAPGEGSGAQAQREGVDLAGAESHSHSEQNEKRALIEEGIGTLGRFDLFDAASLKNLRLTCKALRDLVDAGNILSAARFSESQSNSSAPLDALEVWARGGPWIQRTRSLCIKGELPPALAHQVLGTITSKKPPISKMELVNVGNAGAATDLAAALAVLSQLDSLYISHTAFKGPAVDPKIIHKGLKNLQSLHLAYCPGIEKVGLFSAEGPALPALLSLDLNSVDSLSYVRPWMSQLTYLRFGNKPLEGPQLAETLSGGPLKKLSLFLDNNTHWDWNRLEFPFLTCLELDLNDGDMGDVARCKMPLLRSALVPIGENTTPDSARAFIAAFPELNERSILEDDDDPLWRGPSTGHPTAAVLQTLSREMVPRLESLEWCTMMNLTTVIQNFVPQGQIDGAPLWPSLRSLRLVIDPWRSYLAECPQFVSTLARSAVHFPFLSSLSIEAGLQGTSLGAIEVLLSAAREVEAWPQLQNISLAHREEDEAVVFQKVREVWPHVTMMGYDG